jgi:hypothetical protein
MTETLHKAITAADGHGILSSLGPYANATARRAATVSAADAAAGKVCLQTDTGELYYLASQSGGVPTWLKINTAADSAGVVSPLVTMVGHIKGMFEAATGLSTSAWTDQSPTNAALAAGGGILVGSDGGGAYAYSTGSSYLTSAWTPSGFPVVIDVIVQQDTYTANAPFVSCGVGGPCSVRQGPSSGNMQLNNGSSIAAAFALGAFKRIRAIFTGATSGTADSVQVASASAVTGFAGSTTPSGLSIGAANGSFFNGKWRAVYAYDAVPSGPQATALDAYYVSKYGSGILT